MKKEEFEAVLKAVGEMSEEDLQPIMKKVRDCKVKGVSIYQGLLDRSPQERAQIIATMVALLLYETARDKRDLAKELLEMAVELDLNTLDGGDMEEELAYN